MVMTEAHLRATHPAGDARRATLVSDYQRVRAFTEHLTEGLAPEDMVVQSMPDVSPTKWHLAHTTWFFERFVLMEHLPGYAPLNDTYLYLFNSYYQQAGERHCRDQRGYISRPTVAEVKAYRRHVDEAMATRPGRNEEAHAAGAMLMAALFADAASRPGNAASLPFAPVVPTRLRTRLGACLVMGSLMLDSAA